MYSSPKAVFLSLIFTLAFLNGCSGGSSDGDSGAVRVFDTEVNDFENAFEVEESGTSIIMEGTLSPRDIDDVLVFKTGLSSLEYTFDLTSNGPDFDLYIFHNSSSSLVTVSEEEGNENLTITLEPNTAYKVAVYNYEGIDGTYSLNISGEIVALSQSLTIPSNSSSVQDAEPNELFSPVPAGAVDTAFHVSSGSLSNSDLEDAFSFSTDTARTVSIFLESTNDNDIDLILYDESNLAIDSSSSLSGSESLSFPLNAGSTYTILVSNYAAVDESYTLAVILNN